MRIDDDGIAVIRVPADLDRLTLFVSRLTRALYRRLPRWMRVLLSYPRFRAIVDLAVATITDLDDEAPQS